MTEAGSGIDIEARQAHWNGYRIAGFRDDFLYHIFGADKDIAAQTPSNERLLVYWYRFLLEERLLRYFLKKYVNRFSHALDAGAGTGRVSLTLADAFAQVDSFDLSHIFVDENKKRFKNIQNINFFAATFSDAKLPEKAYDAVVIGGVFMCMSDDEIKEALDTVHNALAEGGVLICRDTLSHGEDEPVGDIKWYRSEEHYERLFAGRYKRVLKVNGANRNIWCTIYRRLPAAVRRLPVMLRFFKQLVRACIGVDVHFALLRGERRHPLASQVFYIYAKQ